MSEQSNSGPNDEKNVSKELAREFRWVEFAQIASNAILAVVGVIALCIYNGQLGEMRKSTKAAQDAAVAAQSAANTADGTLKSTQEQFRTQQRPYIWAFPTKAGKWDEQAKTNALWQQNADGSRLIQWTVGVKNSGQSPAKEVFATRSFSKISTALEFAANVKKFIPDWSRSGESVLPPGEEETVPTGDLMLLNPTQVSEIAKGRIVVYVIGAIKYRDIFNPTIPSYETRYCFVLKPSGLPVGACPEGNAIK